MNKLASQSPLEQGLSVIPFGNGAEHSREQRYRLFFSRHQFQYPSIADIVRASQEGIVFSFKYGMEIMQAMGMDITVIRAGNANMFLSPIFRETLSSITGATIELYDTDGAAGAAKAAGIGVGIYASPEEAFDSLKKIMTVEPDAKNRLQYQSAYERWKSRLDLENKD